MHAEWFQWFYKIVVKDYLQYTAEKYRKLSIANKKYFWKGVVHIIIVTIVTVYNKNPAHEWHVCCGCFLCNIWTVNVTDAIFELWI